MNVQRVAIVGSVAAVAAAIVAGLIVIGSPSEQRLLRLDERRVTGLRQLANRAELEWDRSRRLAASPSELVDGSFLTRVPQDPVTGEPFEYRVTGPRTFDVCATFDRPARSALAGDFWYHGAGRQCFQFEVDEAPER